MRQLVCPGCGAVNRAPDAKDMAAARCGRCGEPLFRAVPVEVTGEEFAAHLKSTRGVDVLVDVWAPWCGPCRMMAPHFASAAATLEPQVRLLKLNSEDHQAAAARLGVASIPALILFRDGREIARQAGAMTAAQIVGWTRQTLASARTRA